MPFIPNTPESLIRRSDSRNPATTCRGITSTGRPCRRPLAAATAAATTPPRARPGGDRLSASPIVEDDPTNENLYCWQHKAQASLSARSSPGPRRPSAGPIEERTSLDTLVDRLGLLELEQTKPTRKPKPKPGPGPASQNETFTSRPQQQPQSLKMTRPKPKHTVSFCFCFTIPVDEAPAQPTRPKPRPLQPTTSASISAQHSRPTRPPASSARPSTPTAAGQAPHHTPTGRILSLIPPTLPPAVASALLAELAKPISDFDEPGYIYMFWLTPETATEAPSESAARSLLVPPDRDRAMRRGERRPSDVLAAFATADASGSGRRASTTGGSRSDGAEQRKTILLKIGRATNVQRRLNEWTRQCGYNLSLIRFYPYIPSSAAPSPSPSPNTSPSHSRQSVPQHSKHRKHHHEHQHSGSSQVSLDQQLPRKMPHSHKVERLIHLELTGLGLRVAGREGCDSTKCNACGKEHREWFEVEASRAAVRRVDEVIRRWVDWDEGR